MSLTLGQLDRGLNARFQQALSQEIDQRLLSAAMVVNSTGRQEEYGWLEAVPTLEEVIDEVAISGVYKSNYTLANKTYAQAISARRDDLEDDQVGGVFQRVQDLTLRARMFPMKLIVDAISANGTGYDNVAFFSASHSTGDSGTQSNIVTGTSGGPYTAAQIQADFDNAIEKLLGFVDGSGNPIHETDTSIRPLVVCPVGLFGLFRQLQNAAIINNTTNHLMGTFDLVASPRLAADEDWYMFNIGMAVKPLVLQIREPIQFERLEANSDIGTLKERFVWKVRWRGVVGYGFWQMAVKVNN